MSAEPDDNAAASSASSLSAGSNVVTEDNDVSGDRQLGDTENVPTPANSMASMSSASNSKGNKIFINGKEVGNEEDDEPIVYEKMSFCKLFVTMIGAAAGNFLEWFDFAVFGLLADELGENFFPSSNQTTRLLSIFTVFAGAFLMRPLGGMLFGYLGDRFGRLFALRLSIFLMAFPTFLTGCLPTYHDIGITATIMLVILRLLQGLSVGGELTGALVYVLEICPQNRRVLFGVLVQISGAGTFLASIVDSVLRAALSESEMTDFGWRIPFWFGLVVAGFGLWMRRALKGSQTFEKLKQQGKVVNNPVSHVFQHHKLSILIVSVHLFLAASGYYTLFVWFPTYFASESLRQSDRHVIENPYGLNVVAMLCTGVAGIASANLADKLGSSSKVMISGGIAFTLGVLVFFPVLDDLDKHEYGGIMVILCIISALFGWYYGPISTWAVDALPHAETRYTGLGIGYNIALALFGGTAPFVGTAVTAESGLFAYAWVLFAIALCSLSVNAVVVYLQQTGKWDYAKNRTGIVNTKMSPSSDNSDANASHQETIDVGDVGDVGVR